MIAITRPSRSNSGPPELPGLIGTSVWMNGIARSPGNERDFALTMPCVTVLANPYGDPIAITQSPTSVRAGSPVATTGRLCASIRITATSDSGSLPSTRPVNSRLSVSFTSTLVASPTTCRFVRITPSASTMKPEPRLTSSRLPITRRPRNGASG